MLLHFGAVDWQARVWLNGQEVGKHQGGYTPFTFDISDAVLAAGENELVVAVWDPTETSWTERGKQMLDPRLIFYTAVSGIWQTVWLEPVPQTRFDQFKLTPDIDAETLTIMVQTTEAAEVLALVFDGNEQIAQVSGASDAPLVLSIPSPKLWSPDSPHLHDLKLSLLCDGEVVDAVDSYFGMRKFSIGLDENGRSRLCLNNQPTFQYGPLDQGYWPDGLYTPPTDAAMRYDIEQMKAIGFNMLRKHVKVEPARYYLHCDQLGILVWQDMPNGAESIGMDTPELREFFATQPPEARYEKAGRQDPESRRHFRQALQEMVDALINVPSISMWVPFNEGWGQFDAREIGEWLKAYDPTRQVDHASGWLDRGGPDFDSPHIYRQGLDGTETGSDRPIILSEFGGYSLVLPEHCWRVGEYGYRSVASMVELTAAYVALLEDELLPWIAKGLSAAVYTQTTDVEIEVNGYLTYDRALLKMDREKITAVHRRMFE